MSTAPLFERFGPQAAGLLPRIKTAMRQAVADSGLSRDQVTDRMNALAEAAGIKLAGGNTRALGAATLDKWLNPADRDHIPGILSLNVFCAALGDPAPLAVQTAAHGLELLDEADRRARDYGRAALDMRRARREMRRLEAQQ